MAALISLILMQVGASENPKVVNRLHYGIQFYKKGLLNFGEDYWHHTFEIELPKGPGNETLDMPSCQQQKHGVYKSISIRTCVLMTSLISSLNLIQQEATSYIQQVIEEIVFMIPEPRKYQTDWSSRALLSFVSDLGHSLFGFATDRQVKVLQQHIQQLVTHGNDLSRIFKAQSGRMSSFMSTLNKGVKQALGEIEENRKAIDNVWHSMDQSLNQTEEFFMSIQEIVIQHLNQWVKLRGQLVELHQGIIQLVHHQLSPLLVSPTTFQHSFQNITHQLNRYYPGFKIARVDLNYYYQLKVLYHRIGHTIFITVPIPVSQHLNGFHLYQVFQFDVPVNAITRDATSLQVPDYFAIDQAQSAVIELTNEQFSICYGGQSIHCPLLPAHDQLKSTHVYQLFM